MAARKSLNCQQYWDG